MGHIKEPKGIDFIIASEPLTEKARNEISAFIRNYKNKGSRQKVKSANTTKPAKSVPADLKASNS
jgi:hypothetical protein